MEYIPVGLAYKWESVWVGSEKQKDAQYDMHNPCGKRNPYQVLERFQYFLYFIYKKHSIYYLFPTVY